MRRRAAWAAAMVIVAFALSAFTVGPASAQTCTILCPTTTDPGPTTTTTLLPTTSTTEPPTSTATTTPTSSTQRQATTTTARSTATTSPSRASQSAATTTTAPSLLVPGSAPDANAAGGRSATGTKASTTNEDRTGMVVAIVITGLLLVALLFALITWRFWRNTRPALLAASVDEPTAEQEPVGIHG